jgi:phosphoribosylanthranilate isomerase
MRSSQVKFCGLTRPEDVASAIALGAGLLGFIIECPSSRRLSVAEAARVANPAKGLAKRVAVTVNPDDDLIRRIAEQLAPDFIQLHGDENVGRVRSIKRQTGTGIIKAVSVTTSADLKRAQQFNQIADYILLDAKPPKGAYQRGGHGASFDWGLLRNFKSETPMILAGGLSPKSIGRAKSQTIINIFDVSSGVEAAPGIKDPSLMAAFMKAARNE